MTLPAPFNGLPVHLFLECGGGSVEEDLAPVRARIAAGMSEWEAVEAEALELEAIAEGAGLVLDTSRGTVADVLRRMLAGPGTCLACGSPVAMGHLCAPCEAILE